MDKKQKDKIASIIVALDDSIGGSSGLGDFVGHLFANVISIVFGSSSEDEKKKGFEG